MRDPIFGQVPCIPAQWAHVYHNIRPQQVLLLMAEILHQLIGSLSHYLWGFIHPRWCKISVINSRSCSKSSQRHVLFLSVHEVRCHFRSILFQSSFFVEFELCVSAYNAAAKTDIKSEHDDFNKE